MAKLLRLPLPVQIFEWLAAAAANENIPSVELARRVLASYYSEKTGSTDPTVAAAAVPAKRKSEPAFGGATPRQKELLLAHAVDAYGRIEEDLGWIFTSPSGRKQIAKIGKDLLVLGHGISLLRESLDELEELRRLCSLSHRARRRLMRLARNDNNPHP